MKFQVRKAETGHRQATWLELFFDLAFVISIATLSHQVVAHPSLNNLIRYVALLVPVWWVWNQFTWYASHFDNDDIPFRFFMLSGVGGTLVMAGGLTAMEQGHDAQFVWAYLFLHGILGLGWLRALRNVPALRSYIALKLGGIGLGLALFAGSLFFGGATQLGLWGIGISLQLILPIIAWSKVRETISVHHHHLAERHGLFTIIVLGESLVALTHSLGHLEMGHFPSSLICLFLFPLALWWIYFDWHYDPIELQHVLQAFGFNYGHFFIYGGLGVVAAGIGIYPGNAAMGLTTLLVGSATFLVSLSAMNLIKSPFHLRVALRLITALVLGGTLFFIRPNNAPQLLTLTTCLVVALAWAESWIERHRSSQ